MTLEQYLGLYAKGWQEGNPGEILSACDDKSYVFDDPLAAKPVTKKMFATHFDGIVEAVKAQLKGVVPSKFMELSNVQTWMDGKFLMAWCQWWIPGTSIRGAGLIKVGSAGVLSERIFYYARPAA